MKALITKRITALACTFVLLGACQDRLDLQPLNDVTADKVYNSELGYYQALAKVYGGMAATGNSGPAGSPDIPGGGDEGFSEYVRGMWNCQELTTDEAVVAWSDVGLPDFHNLSFTPSNGFVRRTYARIFFVITLANEFLRESTDGKISDRGLGGAAANIRNMRNEARLIRAYQYWSAMDLFGNVPFTTEGSAVGGALPPQIERKELFAYIERELKDLESVLPEPRQNEYGRLDKGAAWAMLARMYLNAQVYTGTERNADAITYAKKVIDGGYTLTENYRLNFRADNDLRRNEIIWPVNYDGLRTQCWGGTTYLVCAALGGTMARAGSGISPLLDSMGTTGNWGGLRATKNLPLLFPDTGFGSDLRGTFFRGNSTLTKHNLEITTVSNFAQGYGVLKYRNITSDRRRPNNPSGAHADIDFPLFRPAEMHLIYAEAVLRGGQGGDRATALAYINQLRQRAYGGRLDVGQVTDAEMTLDFILDERARELFWEGHRRTDLIRFGRFTSDSYLWPFKGGVAGGRAVPEFRNLFPIPANELISNTNLKQNPGY